MQRSSLTTTLLTSLSGCLRIAPVGTGGHGRGNLTDGCHSFVIDLRNLGMNPDNRQVGAVDGTAHVDAAGQRNPQFARKFHAGEVIVELVHQGLHDRRTIGRRAVAVEPSLGMNDVGDGVARPSDGKAEFL